MLKLEENLDPLSLQSKRDATLCYAPSMPKEMLLNSGNDVEPHVTAVLLNDGQYIQQL